MDNEAFSALVSERARPKSTKEIAREAVEDEFKRKKRRGGRGGKRGRGSSSESEGGSDDDEGDKRRNDDEAEGGSSEPRWKQLRRAKKKAKEEEEGRMKYRDRARERREGKNVDYAGTSDLLETAKGGVAGGDNELADDGEGNAAEMSKFLGGDEAHTHLVRGLDWALAQKVRREEMGVSEDSGLSRRAAATDEDVDLDATDRSLRAKKVAAIDDPENAMERLARSTHSVLGRSVVSYLQLRRERQRKAPLPGSSGVSAGPSDAGLSVQRSTLSFSLSSNPGDVRRSWEMPPETTLSRRDHERRRAAAEDGVAVFGGRRELTLLDERWIERIRDALSDTNGGARESRADRKKHRKKKKRKERQESSRGDVKAADNEAVGGGKVGEESDEREKDDVANGSGAGQVIAVSESSPRSERDGKKDLPGKEADLSSDEDIFADAGEYVPPTKPSTAKPTGEASNGEKGKADSAVKKEEKPSLFSDLIVKEDVAKKAKPDATGGAFNGSRAMVVAVAPPPTLAATAEGRSKGRSGIIDRDVLGGQGSLGDSFGRAGEGTWGGVSMSAYAGGYGEEMDADFGGLDDDREESEKKKGDGVDKMTTAASREYGSRGGRGRENHDDGGGF